MAKDPARPEGDERAEYSRCVVRIGAKPIAWIDHETGKTVILAGATFGQILVAFDIAMVRLRDAERAVPTVKRDDSAVELRRAGAIEGDPYACDGWTFADEVGGTAGDDHPVRVVRRRIFDDVGAAHRMLDMLDVPPGPLTARIGLLGLPIGARGTSAPIVTGDVREDILRREVSAAARRSHGSGEPLADVADVKIPKPDDVLAVLDQLTGEEAFKVFDHVNVLHGRTAEDRRWVLTDADDVRQMIAECCAVALNLGKLAEVYKAAREALARKEAR